MLRSMRLIRAFDEAAITLLNAGLISGGVHLSIGQEAEIAGACAALKKTDYMAGNHRSHGHPIAKGSAVGPLMAELLGKATGVCRGKGGSLHLADFSIGSLGESGIVGSQMPVAVGAGLASQIRGDDRVSLCFFGDGAAHEGASHEALNLAAVWSLPVIFLCENNLYAATVALSEMMAPTDIAARAVGYGMPGVIVDGQDVVAVYEAVNAAVERARAGQGPTLIEAKTYRFYEHALGIKFDIKYRPDEEIEIWKGRDPIANFEARAVQEGILSPGDLRAIEDDVQHEISAAVEFAKESPMPQPDERYEDVFVSPAIVH